MPPWMLQRFESVLPGAESMPQAQEPRTQNHRVRDRTERADARVWHRAPEAANPSPRRRRRCLRPETLNVVQAPRPEGRTGGGEALDARLPQRFPVDGDRGLPGRRGARERLRRRRRCSRDRRARETEKEQHCRRASALRAGRSAADAGRAEDYATALESLSWPVPVRCPGDPAAQGVAGRRVWGGARPAPVVVPEDIDAEHEPLPHAGGKKKTIMQSPASFSRCRCRVADRLTVDDLGPQVPAMPSVSRVVLMLVDPGAPAGSTSRPDHQGAAGRSEHHLDGMLTGRVTGRRPGAAKRLRCRPVRRRGGDQPLSGR